MNRNIVLLLSYAVGVNLLVLCQDASAAGSAPPAHSQVAPQSGMQASADKASGTVIETMNSGGYTYVQIDMGNEKIWVAGPVTAVNVGDVLSIGKNMPMNNFHSKTLNRDFDVLYFVSSFGVAETGHMQKPHGDLSKNAPISADIKKADNGKNIEEIYSQKQQLSGKSVRIRGVVVKYTTDVLGKDWVHLRDNSSTSDLTVTTKDKLKMGDVVLAEGVLTLSKDYGYGYIYDVIIEDAKVTVE